MEWISVKDRLPANVDAGEKGYVMTYLRKDRQNGYPTRICFNKWNKVTPETHTHWMRLPKSPKTNNLNDK